MRHSFFLPVLAATAALTIPVHAFATTPLDIGDMAPALKVKSFVKGTPITKFDPSKIYVIEFWATWCGPCKISIPHLTELQKQNPKVSFVGVSILEDDQSLVKPFVSQMGAKMGYAVALDTAVGESGFMAKNWMKASEEPGIPTAFIIKSGKIAWIGHPMEMEEPLKKIQAGNWNIKSAKVARSTQKTREKQIMEVQKKALPFLQSGDNAKALVVINKAILDTPDLEEDLGTMKLNLLLGLKKQDEAVVYADHLVSNVFKDAMSLNQIAWALVDPSAREKAGKDFYPAALKAAQKAVDLTGSKEADILDTLAWTHFVSGNAKKAVEIEEKVIAMGGKNPEFAKNLATFKKG